MDAYIRGKRIRVVPSMSIGKGGEADIFNIGGGKALKLFKPPDHPDFRGFPDQQEAARRRIAEHQQKLRDFPKNLPPHIIRPEEVVTNSTGRKILGYIMHFINNGEELLRYSNKIFRQGGINNDTIVSIFKDLHHTVSLTHNAGVVIGDFNDLNVMVCDTEAFLIDVDSFQFGKFLCMLYTERFVDPLLCNPNAKRPMLIKKYASESDWYAFCVMLMQCLLFVDPYGGIYKPKNKKNRIPHTKRPLKRITVFNPEVVYPKTATPYDVLPEELLEHFHLVFEKDRRACFPISILEMLRWTKCTNCGIEHARNVCPNCAKAVPPAIKEVTVIRGKVKATRIFQTRGIILFASVQNGDLQWLYHENQQFKREDTSVVMTGDLDPKMRFRIFGRKTLIGRLGQLLILGAGEKPVKLGIDRYGTLPVFDANNRFVYRAYNGALVREEPVGTEYIGDVLQGQTLFWVGPEFGFGFYRAGELSVAFVFNAYRRGINDTVKLPQIRGQLVDSTCFFTKEYCWFLIAVRESGKNINRCMVIRPDGKIEATAQAEEGDGSWLSNLRGKCAAGNFLLSATDDGIVRVDPENGGIVKTNEFPDTEPFVDSGCYLFPSKDGLYAVKRNEIIHLTISR